MAATNRLFVDLISGTLSADPGVSGTTLDGAFLADLPVVADPDFIALTIDPEAADGDPEIVWVTVHSSAATSATVLREQEGTTERAHDSGTKAIAGLTADGLTSAIRSLYPVGSIYFNASVATNPGTLLGFGTWAAFGEGRVLVGLDSGDTDFDTVEEEGGSKTQATHVHEVDPPITTSAIEAQTQVSADSGNDNGVAVDDHTHTVNIAPFNSAAAGDDSIVQPYVTVYMWKRTA
jgi:hypothetical protein